jgi:hypothetical protein
MKPWREKEKEIIKEKDSKGERREVIKRKRQTFEEIERERERNR